MPRAAPRKAADLLEPARTCSVSISVRVMRSLVSIDGDKECPVESGG